MSRQIAQISAMEILDSRGIPTLRVQVTLDNGVRAAAAVPSGASTGEAEAVELRDRDMRRHRGKGVLQAIRSVTEVIAPILIGCDPAEQVEIDRRMIERDGTPNKAKLGANATLGVSMAVARAAATDLRQSLYAYLGGPAARRLPVPMMNIINGGTHAENNLDFQEFMIVPHGAPTFAEAVRYGAETFHALKALLHERGYGTAVGDEGGFAPELSSQEEACELILAAISAAGYKPGQDISIALDPAASAFWVEGQYHLKRSGGGLVSSQELSDLYAGWIATYPILSIEDGMGEKDWEGFRRHTARIGKSTQVVGDDIYVTNTELIARGIRENTTNAALIKLNQIGTVTETIEAVELCRSAGWHFVISHRSGETEDAFIADFAVAMGGGQIKAGSLSRSERLAKYNRLLEIESELGSHAEYARPFRS